MKLYIEEDEVLFDYSDIDPEAPMDYRASEYRKFLLGSGSLWEDTLKPKVKRMIKVECGDWRTPYGNACERRRQLDKCDYIAKTLMHIEISDDFKIALEAIEEECRQLYQIEVDKEEKRKAAEQWKSICKYGCRGCSHLHRWEDDYRCTASGDTLPEKNVPIHNGVVYFPFNNEPFPTEKCPLNVDNKELIKLKGDK